MPEQEEAIHLTSKYKLKKLVEKIMSIKGRHTELVTVYIPAGANLHDVVTQLRGEAGTAENIKSKPVRKNVTTALEKIIRHLQFYKKTPEHGLAIMCGNISQKEGAVDIELWAIEPPEPVKTKLYWCDQQFVTEPLEEMIAEKEIYGIICLDKSEADIALLNGKKIESIAHFESIVPGKSRAGGQSSARFARVREGMLNDWLKHIGEASNKIFAEHREVIGILLSGSGPIKEIFFKEEYLHADIKKKILGLVDTSYTGEHGLHETLVRGEDLIREAGVVQERKMLEKFFTELQKPHGFSVYGIENILDVMRKGAVDIVIINEKSDMREYEFECLCGLTKKIVSEYDKNKQKCGTCERIKKIIGEKDLIEFFEEEAKNYGTKVFVVSSDTREGEQFLKLGGVGAILRYHV
jgi:peptide chain release factor subunit 1